MTRSAGPTSSGSAADFDARRRLRDRHLVHTANGLVPIAKVQVGDWVFAARGSGARSTLTGRQSVRPREQEVYRLTSHRRQDRLVLVTESPIFVRGKGWTPAGRSCIPLKSSCATRTACTVFNLSRSFGPLPGHRWIQGGYGGLRLRRRVRRRVIDLRNQFDSHRLRGQQPSPQRFDRADPENHLRVRVYNSRSRIVTRITRASSGSGYTTSTHSPLQS